HRLSAEATEQGAATRAIGEREEREDQRHGDRDADERGCLEREVPEEIAAAHGNLLSRVAERIISKNRRPTASAASGTKSSLSFLRSSLRRRVLSSVLRISEKLSRSSVQSVALKNLPPVMSAMLRNVAGLTELPHCESEPT